MSRLSKGFKVDFTQVPNQIINDKNVSLKAKGLYLFMLSKPDNWDFSLNGMASQLKESKPAILRIIDELLSFGYLEKIKRREANKQACNDYILHKEPYFPSESQNVTHKMRLTKCDSQNVTTSNTKTSNTKKSNTLSSGERDFYKFKEEFIKRFTSRLFVTKGIGFLPDTQFTINEQGLIFNTVSLKTVDREDAFKIWKYLFDNQNTLNYEE